MTLQDWIDESGERFNKQPPHVAAKRSVRALINGGFRRVGRHIGQPIWARDDWDVLVVLDACRGDLLNEVIDEYPELPDEVGSHWSNASCSIDWQLRNWKGRPEHTRDAGYVTANPFAEHEMPDARSADLGDEEIGHLAPLYRTDWQEVKPGISTVPPEAVTDHTVAAWRERRDLRINRLVAHYMQPHEPYITRPEWGDGDHELLGNLIDPEQEAGSSIWPLLEDGEVDRDEFWEVYKDNLRWVLDDVVDRLLPNVDGRVVLTADHGNAMGEWGEWHHPPGAIGPSVRKVPWVGMTCDDFETIHPDVELEGGESVEAGTAEQLEALGYMEGEA